MEYFGSNWSLQVAESCNARADVPASTDNFTPRLSGAWVASVGSGGGGGSSGRSPRTRAVKGSGVAWRHTALQWRNQSPGATRGWWSPGNPVVAPQAPVTTPCGALSFHLALALDRSSARAVPQWTPLALCPFALPLQRYPPCTPLPRPLPPSLLRDATLTPSEDFAGCCPRTSPAPTSLFKRSRRDTFPRSILRTRHPWTWGKFEDPRNTGIRSRMLNAGGYASNGEKKNGEIGMLGARRVLVPKQSFERSVFDNKYLTIIF